MACLGAKLVLLAFVDESRLIDQLIATLVELEELRADALLFGTNSAMNRGRNVPSVSSIAKISIPLLRFIFPFPLFIAGRNVAHVHTYCIRIRTPHVIASYFCVFLPSSGFTSGMQFVGNLFDSYSRVY